MNEPKDVRLRDIFAEVKLWPSKGWSPDRSRTSCMYKRNKTWHKKVLSSIHFCSIQHLFSSLAPFQLFGILIRIFGDSREYSAKSAYETLFQGVHFNPLNTSCYVASCAQPLLDCSSFDAARPTSFQALPL